jgi:hypothetical protein
VLAQKMSHSQPCLIAISDRDRAHESSAMRPDGSASHYQPRRSSASGDHQQSNGNEVHHGGLGQTNNNHRVYSDTFIENDRVDLDLGAE